MKNKRLIVSLISLIALFLPNTGRCINAVEYNNRGIIYGKQSNYAQAIQDFTKAIEIKPDYYEVYSDRGVAYNAQGNYPQAIKDFTRAIEINPDFQKAYNNLAWLYATAKDKNYKNGTKAITLALKAVSLEETGGSLDTLGAAYVEDKQYEKAIEAYKTVIEKDKTYIKLYQKSLKEKGYYSGTADGIYTRELEKALRSCVLEGNYL